MSGFDPRSDEAAKLIARARKASDNADRAFRRWFGGEVESSSAAARLQNKADDAWADVRLRIQNGDLIEWNEGDLAEAILYLRRAS